MNARVRKKKNNYYIELEWYHKGNRETKTISVRKELGLDRPAKKKEATALRDKIIHEQRQGIYVQPSSKPFGEFMTEWIENHKYNIKPTTYESYKSKIIKHIVPEFSKIPLSSLRPSHIKAFYSKKLQDGGRADGKPGGLSNRVVRYMHTIMGAALDAAIEDELIVKNVVKNVTPPAYIKPTIEYWSWELAKEFLGSTRNDRYHLFYYIALSTGMSRGEILGLRWRDISWKKHTISLRQSVVPIENKAVIQPSLKTKSRERTLDVSENFIAILKKQKKKQSEEMLALGIKNPNDLVFLTTHGTILHPRDIDSYLERAIKRFNKKRKPDQEKLNRISPHGLRHTYATYMLEEGVHPKVVSERLGHASIQITLDIYSHVLPRLHKKIATLTDDLN